MTRHSPQPLRLLAIVILIPLGACSSSQRGPYGSLDAPPPGGVLVTVENSHVLDMRVSLLRGGVRMPLGVVATLERRTFAVPSSMVGHSGTVRLLADPIGSPHAIASDHIPAALGDRVTWSLLPNLSLSHHTVRRAMGN